MYKLSQFVFHTESANGDLLLYNTLIGRASLLKIRKPYDEIIREVLCRRENPEVLPQRIRNVLIEKEFLIPEDWNEHQQLKALYIDCIDSPILELTLLPTEQCNFRCRYCYESFPNTYMDESVRQGVLKFVSRNISRYKGLHISWFGGEPLLGLDTIVTLSDQMMDICRCHHKPYTASITTNGYLLDCETFRKLLRAKVLYFQITIDGLKKTHDYQRPLCNGEGSFDRILFNLETIRDRITSSCFRITLRTNFSREMIAHIPAYKEFFGTRFGQDPRFQFFFRPVMDWGGDRIDEFRDSLIGERLMTDIYQTAMDYGPKLNFIYEDFLNPGESVCYAAKKNAYTITPKGEIYKCTCEFSSTPQARVGEINAEQGERMDSYRCAQWLCQPDHCDNDKCFFLPNCLGECCPAQRVLQRPAQTKCPLEKRNLAMTLRLLDSQNNSFEEVL